MKMSSFKASRRDLLSLVGLLRGPGVRREGTTARRPAPVPRSLDAAAATPERVVRVATRGFEITPSMIETKLNEPVILEPTTLDRTHGFQAPELGIDVVTP
jgi:hypothetical protein